MNRRTSTQPTKTQPTGYWDRETALVAQFAACVSFISFAYYLQHGGFLLSDTAWQSGIGGSIPSMVAYVLGTAGIFRLVRSALSVDSQPDSSARIAAWLSAIVYAANPNLIYLQTTAMTESLYLALFVWAVAYFSDFVQQTSRKDGSILIIVQMRLMSCCCVPHALRRMVPGGCHVRGRTCHAPKAERSGSARWCCQIHTARGCGSDALACIQRDHLSKPAGIRQWTVFRPCH
jgi:hypothetical protein